MSNKKDADKRKEKLVLQKRYEQRITTARHGREAFGNRDFVMAAKKYNEYLSVLAELKGVSDIYLLSPTHFDQKKEVTELLLISHIYWELARIHELTPKLQHAYSKCLVQFVKFTANQPFQVLNAEMLRKYIKKSKNSPQSALLNDTYSQIFIQSKGCYIATNCFGTNHIITKDLRKFRDNILRYKVGFKFVEVYYRYSPKLISVCNLSKPLNSIFKSIFIPPLYLFSKAYKFIKMVLCI